MNRRTFWMVALGLTLAAPSLTFAQNRGGGGPGGGGFDPARIREFRVNAVKDQIGATPEEWTVLQPKLEKVIDAQTAAAAGRGFGFGRGGPRRGGDQNATGGDQNATGGNRPRGGGFGSDTPVGKAANELRDAVENKDTPQEQIATKLKALRDARAKAKADLDAAQKDLQGVVTPRQEAVLVANGMLE
jgi:hypothetical protein